MKRKIVQRLFAVTTASILLLSCSGVVEAAAAEIELQKIADAKISDTLKAKMSQRSTDKIPVILWTSDLNMNEVQAETTVSRAPATVRMMSQSEPEHDLEYLQNYGTDEEIQGYIEAKRAKAREEYTEMNQKFIAEQLPAGAEVTFVSEYSPVIFAEIYVSDVTKAARSSKVETADTYNTDSTNVSIDKMNISVPTIRAAYVRDTQGSKGAGVKIGQIESGVPDKNLPQFNSSKIHPLSDSITLHANRVASVMVAKNYGGYQGIVPEAELYCIGIGNSTDPKVITPKIEKLIENGVNIINASCTLGEELAEYSFMSKWIDHISASHDIHFVQAAGNNGANTIGGGGYAYNSIVVGASNSNGNASITNDTRYSWSSYSTNDKLVSKPDLTAPGENIKVAGYTAADGARLHVTGTIAQLCCFIPALKTQQTSVKALLIAGVNNTADGSGNRKVYDLKNSNYKYWGAGIVDPRGTRWAAIQSRYSRSTFRPADAAGTTKTYTFKATSSNSFIRVALCFMKVNIPTTGTSTNPHPGISQVGTEANVDLTVTGPGFSASSTSTVNNTEIVDIPNPVAGGTYTVKVKLVTKSDQNVPFGIAWR